MSDAIQVNSLIINSALSTIDDMSEDTIETDDLNILRVVVHSMTEISEFST